MIPVGFAEKARNVVRARRARILASTVLVAIGTLLAAALAFATSTSSMTGQGAGSTTTGSLTLTETAHTTCDYTASPIVPGTSMTPCSFKVTYTNTGSIPAYVALNVLIVTHAGSGPGAVPLYNPGSPTPPGPGLTFIVKDDDASSNSYDVPVTAVSNDQCTGNAAGDLGEPAGSVCYQATNELAAWGASNKVFEQNDTVTWTITPSFASINDGSYQGATASITLAAQAVQQPANTIECTSTPTIGQSCTPTGSFSWS